MENNIPEYGYCPFSGKECGNNCALFILDEEEFEACAIIHIVNNLDEAKRSLHNLDHDGIQVFE